MPIPSYPQVPLIFGPGIYCGGPGDEWAGDNNNGILYGSASVSASFSIPSQESSIQVSVMAMIAAGAPRGGLVLTLYDPSRSAVLATATVPASAITSTSPAWTPFVTMTPASPLAPGTYYWIKVTSPGGTSTAYYRVLVINFGGNWWDPETSAGYTPPAGLSYEAGGGSSTIWIKDAAGNDLELCPYGTSGDVSLVGTTMVFTAKSNYQVNGVIPWLSDCYYMLPGTYGAAFVLTDLTTNTVLGSAPVSLLTAMTTNPPQFQAPINIVAGHQYSISLQQTGTALSNDVYGGLIRGSVVNPPQASFNDSPSGQYWWGHLFLSDFTQYRVVDYGNDHISTADTPAPGNGGIGGASRVGVRLVPKYAETVTEISLLMYAEGSVGGKYPSGTPIVVSLYASNEAGPNPTGSPLYSATVDSGTLPTNGRFVVPGLSWAVAAGVPVWVVFAAPSAPYNYYVCDRCVTGWRYLSLWSGNSGSSWGYFGQGPTDLAVAAVASQEILGSPYDGASSPLGGMWGSGVGLSSANLVAQPFILDEAATMNAVSVTVNGNATATVYPDNGAGAPDMKSPLGSGTVDSYYLGGMVLFSPGIPLEAGTKYWIVYSGSGTISLSNYWTQPWDLTLPAGYGALVSASGGNSWSAPYSDVSSVTFLVGLLPSGSVTPPPSQPVPTTLTLTAQAL